MRKLIIILSILLPCFLTAQSGGENREGYPAANGTVTSIGLTVPTGLSVSGSPITSAGTFAVTNNMSAGFVKSAGVGSALSSASIAIGDLPTITVAKGGTNITSYTVGDILYASGTTTISKLADIATGNVLLTGGVGVAPFYGKVGLTTHVSGVLSYANGGTTLSTLGTALQLPRMNAGGTAWEWFTPSYLTSETNLFTVGGLTNTAFVTHTDNFGFEITGTAAKRLISTNGTYNNSLVVNSVGSVISATDGTNTANSNVLANGNYVINSSTGNYLIDTAPDTDTDAEGNVLLRNGSGFVNQVNRAAFEVLTGSTDPVNGTTTAYETGQLYINNASPSNPVVWFAHFKSTDPDAAATGSVWQKLYRDTMYIKLTPISKSTAITATGELEGDYFTIDNTLAGWELDQITYAITGNTATTGTMQMGIRRYDSSNSAVSISGLATFTTSDIRKTASPGITVVEGDYYVLIVNAESFDNDATGMTATIRFVK